MKRVPEEREKKARRFPTGVLSPLRGLIVFWVANPQLKLRAIVCRLCEAPKTGGYALDCFTASTQRPQMVGCSGFRPMSVSQCQQRSHFWPSA
jgi:hypothetical protein